MTQPQSEINPDLQSGFNTEQHNVSIIKYLISATPEVQSSQGCQLPMVSSTISYDKHKLIVITGKT